MRTPIFYFSGLIFLFLFSCNSAPEQKNQHYSLKWSAAVDSLVKDTTHIGQAADSLRSLLINAQTDTEAINYMNLWSGLNKVKAQILLVNETEEKSIQLKYEYGRIDALFRKGNYYHKIADPESADSLYNLANAQAEKQGFKKIQAQCMAGLADEQRARTNFPKASEYYHDAINICNEIHDKYWRAYALAGLGDLALIQSKYSEAIQYFEDALFLDKEIGNMLECSHCLKGLGDCYRQQNNSSRALGYYQQSYNYAVASRDQSRMALCIGVIGQLYLDQENYPKAYENFSQALAIAQKQKNGTLISQCYAAIGKAKSSMLEYDSSNYYFEQALTIAREKKSPNTQAVVLANMGDNYFALKNYDKALEIFKDAIALSEQTKNKNTLSACYKTIGEIALIRNNIADAKTNGELSLQYARETKNPQTIEASAELLNRIYGKLNNPATQLEMFKLFVQMKDSMNNEKEIKKFDEIEYAAKEDGLKAEAAAKEKTFKAEQAQKESEIHHQRILTDVFIAGFLILGILAFVIFRTLQQNKKAKHIIEIQKSEVEHQKEIVEEKQKEILDSFTYAKRLQDAILPPANHVKEFLPDSFILYKPKDIVAGDFYWMEVVNEAKTNNSELILIAAADCTGHGVPGALVSIVCSNALNRTVKEFGIKEPGKILDKVRELVIETFQKSTSDVKDGMDISLCAISKNAEGGAEVKWSGANNALWYYSNGKLNEVTPDKQPIGKVENVIPFTTHSFHLNQGDTLFLGTDGYADQFGGPKGKKFKSAQLKSVLEKNISENCEGMKNVLDQTFESWKGNLEQVDDVCVIGIRV